MDFKTRQLLSLLHGLMDSPADRATWKDRRLTPDERRRLDRKKRRLRMAKASRRRNRGIS